MQVIILHQKNSLNRAPCISFFFKKERAPIFKKKSFKNKTKNNRITVLASHEKEYRRSTEPSMKAMFFFCKRETNIINEYQCYVMY